ncbi:MAG: hypothetical protein K5978_05110 [Campylobacter sp.]|nr:hypothetical protein [Campylobacter sp.]
MVNFRKAFSFIELIFAIVISGIVAFAVPSLLKLSSDQNAKTLINESVLMAKLKLNEVFSAPYTCAYINQDTSEKTLYLPMFVDKNDMNFLNNTNFYKKYDLDGDERRFFVFYDDYKNDACNDSIMSVDKFNNKSSTSKYADLKLDSDNFFSEGDNDFFLETEYEISVSKVRNPYKFDGDNTKDYDSKFITITAKTGDSEVKLYSSVSNISEIVKCKSKKY